MKKIISFALVLALCLALFAGCQPQTNEPAESGLEKAKQYLNNYFQGSDAKTATDYQVPGIILIDGVTYNVEWTTDVEAIVVTRLENNMVQIDLPELASEKVDYVLTATVSDADGKTITYSINREIPKSDSIGKNDEQIVEEAYTLPSYNSYDKTSGQYKDKDGNVIEGTVVLEGVTVTGVVKSIRIPYDAGYNNITVIIQVGDLADKPIDCYRLTGDGIADLAPGDTVTIQGTLANYQGTVQFAAASVAMAIEKGPEVTCPTTPAEILTAAKALEEGWSLPYKSTMTGVVTEITSAYAANYMNLTCNIEVDGNKIICYRLLGELGANLKVGDTITVTGYLMNYKGDLEYGQGCTLDSLVPGEGGSTEEPTEPTPVTKIEYVDAPAVGTAYKLVMNQAGLGKHLGVTGTMNGYYWATSESFDEMVDVYLEAVENSYRIYFTVDGVKTYMNIIPRDNDATKTNVVFQTLEANANPTAYILNTEHKFIYATGVTSDDWYLGTYGTNMTVGASKTSYIDDKSTIGVSQFVAWFAVAGTSSEEPGTEPSEPTVTEPTVTEPTVTEPAATPSTPAEIVDAAYALEKGAALTGTYTLTGKISAIDTAYNSQFSNISVVIRVEGREDKPILCYRMKGTGAENLKVGDVITVTGVLKNYNGTIEFDANCTFVMVSAHTCTSFSDATCLAPSACTECGTTVGEVIACNFVDGTCTVCGATQGVSYTTVSKTHTEMATIAGVTAGQNTGVVSGKNIALDDNITVVFGKGSASSDPCIYAESVRVYQNGATITIKAAAGHTLKTVKLNIATKSGGQGPITVTGGTADNASAPTNLVYTITADNNASEIVVTTAGTTSSTRVYIASIEVTYA